MVNINGILGNTNIVNGVLQGSVIGPKFFILDVNSICNVNIEIFLECQELAIWV